jgi:hypothetical protein
MPYIPQKDRDSSMVPATAGELNWKITTTIQSYLEPYGISYQTLNEVIGVLECVKAELYRRVVAPYEDGKCAINGDVYDDRN